MANSGMKEEQCISIQCFEQEQYCTMKNEQVGTGTSLHGTMLFEDSIALE